MADDEDKVRRIEDLKPIFDEKPLQQAAVRHQKLVPSLRQNLSLIG
jgi:hypothetical protein